MTAPALARGPERESGLAARWARQESRALRLEDGRALRVIFPGVPGGPAGPDFRDAILDAGGDYLRGSVEVHLVASGWTAHRHHLDPAYASVVLHVVAENDTGALATLHGHGRAIPVLVLPPAHGARPMHPAFVPPCALAGATGRNAAAVLAQLGRRRMRAKAARVVPLLAAGEGQALYTLLLETLAGPANRAAFAALARRLPLAVLLERSVDVTDRALAATAELKFAARDIVLRRAGLRPLAAPARRLEAAGRLVVRLWRPGAGPGWPALLAVPPRPADLQVAGVGRALAVELIVNAILPVALAGARWTETEADVALASLPSPGTYGRLRRLEGWLGTGGPPPFRSAAALQGGLLLHADYCSRGRCGRCPLST